MIEALLFPLASLHVNKPEPKSYNEVNPGVIAELDAGYMLGAYLNSHDKLTLIAGKRFEVFTPRVGVLLAACTGYRSIACGAFMIRPTKYVEITYAPRIGNYNADTFGIAVRVPL